MADEGAREYTEVGTAGDGATIRSGTAADVPVVLALLDGAVAWLAARGRTGEWGTEPWSARPKAVALVERYLTEGTPWVAELDGSPVGTVTLTDAPVAYVNPAPEPERYVHLLAADHRFAGRGIGAALLRHAATETRREGVSLLRVDCYAGDDRALVAYYERQGFTPTEALSIGENRWPGQVLEMRV